MQACEDLGLAIAGATTGVFVSDFRRDRPGLFRAACKVGLDGMVSKRRDRPYRPGRSPDWI
jgi:bifunctional non-homologous end joining protein LigD